MLFRFGNAIRGTAQCRPSPGLLRVARFRQNPQSPARISARDGNKVLSTTAILGIAREDARKGQVKQARPPPYTPEEDTLIVDLRQKRIGWRGIQKALPHRALHGLRRRWEMYLRPLEPSESQLLHVPYTLAERQKMQQLRESGSLWREIQDEHFPKRKWRNLKTNFNTTILSYDSPNDSKGKAWTEEEDQKLLRMKDESQFTWAQICGELSNRSSVAIQSRYWKLKHRATEGKPKYY